MGTLFIVATPIGNRSDITIRALKTLLSVPIVLCEDTRKTGSLLSFYRTDSLFTNILSSQEKAHKPELISYYEENEYIRLPTIINTLEEGNDVALVSDAGTPLISDPGFTLVRECLKRNINLSPIPGASSIITALSMSGFPTDSFAFLGYIPKKRGKKNHLLQSLCKQKDITISTFVFLESPFRIQKTLEYIAVVLPTADIAIARELTKIHEECISGTAEYLLQKLTFPLKGEMVILMHLR